jgi:hypothetical protein
MESLIVARQQGKWFTPYTPQSGFSHVVICGIVNLTTLNGLVDELLHEDHDLVLKVKLLHFVTNLFDSHVFLADTLMFSFHISTIIDCFDIT